MNRKSSSWTVSTVVTLKIVQTVALWMMLLALAIIFLTQAARAQDPGTRTVDGLAVYFGVMPGEILK